MTSRSLSLYLSGATLRAAATPAGGQDNRVREGVLVPWDEPGRTNLGHGLRVRRQFAQGLQAGAKLVGVYGHTKPDVEPLSVSRVIGWEDRPEGLWAQVFVNRTPLGDQLLAEIDGGARDGLSIEASDLVFDTAGDVVAGRLDFFAHVPVGAFDSARAHALAATVTTNGAPVTLPAPAYQAAQPAQQLPAGTLGQPAQQQAAQPAPAAPLAQPFFPAPQQQGQPAQQLQAQVAGQAPAPAGMDLAGFFAALQQFQAASHVAPAPQQQAQQFQPTSPAQQLQAAAMTGLPTPGVPQAQGPVPTGLVRRLSQLQAAQAQGNQDPQLIAALHDVTNSGLGATGMDLFQSPAAAVGQELWSGSEYVRRFVPLMNFQELTAWKFTGWRWVEKPRVQNWAGDKTEVPTNPVRVEPVEGEAERCAGGWDVDRKFRDLPTPGFWEGFYRAQTESYREVSDMRAAAAIVAAARDITIDANVPAGYAASNVAQDDILRAAALGGAILEDTPNVRRPADYVLMNTGDWLGLMDLTNLDLPAFLSLLGVKPENFLRTDQVPAGRVILGVKPAMTFRELGGGAPIRVEALDVARGGIDSAVYGYTGTSLDRPGGVISVPLVVPAPAA